jgi:hypothetical protein
MAQTSTASANHTKNADARTDAQKRRESEPEDTRRTVTLETPLGGVRLPWPPPAPSSQVLWWGGLAGVAVLGVIEWPVAAAVAAGTWVAEHRARSGKSGSGESAED